MEFDSASAIVGGAVTGRHLLHIEGYSHTKLLPVDECIYSQPFSVGDRTWRIGYFPSGLHLMDILQGMVHSRDITIFVDLDDSITESAYADTRFLLLDRAGNEMPTHTKRTGRNEFKFPGDGLGCYFTRESVEALECLVDDCFKVLVEITVFTGVRSENRRAMASAAAVPPPDLHRHLGGLLASMDGADVTFQVAGETFRAHRCVLAARSPVFKAELFGAMRGVTNAAAEVCIRVHNMVSRVFSALLHFVYTDSLPPPEGTGHADAEEEAAMAQHLLEAADRYDMPRLKRTCEDKLCRCLDARTAATTLVLADQHGCHRLKKACIERTCEDKLCRCLDARTAATTLVLADQHGCHRLKKACIERTCEDKLCRCLDARTAATTLVLADQHGCHRLKKACIERTCEDKLCRCLDARTAATTLVLADQHGCHRLKKACIDFLRCPLVLKAVMATDGFELIRSYPNLLREVISKITPPCYTML